jgi:hypothetical protein
VRGDVELLGDKGEGLSMISWKSDSAIVLGVYLGSDHVPLLCVVKPRFRTSSRPRSSISRSTAWNAPRTLKAPIRCRCSPLKKSRTFGLAGSCPSHFVLFSASGVCGVDAMLLRVVLVRIGVVWMCGRMSACAASTDARVRRRDPLEGVSTAITR